MFAPRITRAVLLSATMSAAAGALALSPLSVRAAEEPKHEEHMGKMPKSMAQLMKMDPEECMKMMDKDHKGYVTKKDFMKFQEELWKNMDKNKDNRVDHAEFTDAG
jgi:hypothetical protein